MLTKFYRDRPLAGLEKWHVAMNQLGGATTCLNVSAIRGTVPDEVAREALRRLQARHPLLRVGLSFETGEPRFVEVPSAAKLKVVSGQEGDWQKYAEEAINQVFPVSGDLLWNATLVHEPEDRTYLVTGWHHAIIDGMGMLRFTDDFLRVVSGQTDGLSDALNPLPPVDAMVPRLPPQDVFPKTFVDTPLMDAVPSGQARTRLLYRNLPADAVERLVGRCRREKTTVFGALGAATLLAIRQGLCSSRAVTFRLLTPVDFRRIAQPPVVPESLGFLIGWMMSDHPIGEDEAFWDLARDCRTRVKEGIDSHWPIHFGGGLGYLPFDAVFGILQGLLSAPNGRTVAATISSKGKHPFLPKYGPFELESSHCSAAVHVSGPTFHVSTHGHRGQMSLSFSYPAQLLSEAEATAMAGKVEEWLTQW